MSGVIVYNPLAEFYAYWAIGEIVPRLVKAYQAYTVADAEGNSFRDFDDYFIILIQKK